MSKVWVNDADVPVEGAFSFSTSVDNTVKPPVYTIEGVFKCKEKYFDQIDSLLNKRYKVEGIQVIREEYGSEEDAIAYYFIASNYGIALAQKE